jgi:hypothetical protein
MLSLPIFAGDWERLNQFPPEASPEDSRYFQMRLKASVANPLSKVKLHLILTGIPPQPDLYLKSTVYSEIAYDLLVPLSAYSKLIEWEIPTPTGYTGNVVVVCGSVISNSVYFKKF